MSKPDDLFARAKGPRRACGEWTVYAQLEGLVCPWCGHDCNGVAHKWVTAPDDSSENAVTACPACEREFMCPDEKGNLACVGLLSPADMKYLAMKEAAVQTGGEAVSGEVVNE